jgi:hypothetical protein
MLKIRKVHILVRHLFNQKDHSAGIFFKEKEGGIDWLWTTIEETVDLYNNDTKEFSKRGGEQSFNIWDAIAQGNAVMTRCFQQSCTIKTPVTTVLFDPIDKPTGDDCGIFNITLLC